MKRTLLLITLLLTMSFAGLSQNPLADITCAPNEILYVTKYGYPLQEDTFETEGFGGYFVKNTYKNGVGKLTFDFDITQIPEGAFKKCQSLTHIKLPNGVTEIGEGAFYGCTSLRRFYGKYASQDGRCIIVNGKLMAFAPAGLTKYTIPNSVTSIGEGAFFGCSSLMEFKGKYASEDGRCLIVDGILNSFAPSGITEYTIPDSVTSIGERAFFHCTSLTSITIPDSVTSIGDGAFSGCSSLSSITIPDSVTSIGRWAFDECSSLKSITIPESVTEIGDYAFSGCMGELIINSKIVETDYSSYSSPYWLIGSKFTSLTIGNGVTKIGNGAFSGCSSLKSITIPDGVTEIGYETFYYCSSLAEVYCKPTTPPEAGDEVFYNNASGRKIYVPAESVDAYKTAQYWSRYADSIVGYDFE